LALLFVPYFQDNPELTLVILIGVAVGSLVPDADSPDAAIFHERVHVKGKLGTIINGLISPLFPIFGTVTKYAIYKPAVLIFGNTILKKYNIGERHRGFLHSFIGIGTATLLTAVYLLIVLLLLKLLNGVYFISFILSYIFGALMHLLEDSATVTGIQFNYPFSNLILKGEVVTRPGEAAKPDQFTMFLGISIVALFFALELKYIPLIKVLITIATIIYLILSWTVFLLFVAKVKLVRGELKSYSNVQSLF
jgi:membrane-bound metal-dependent hydrolase YbcI (DUF457 family)